MPRDVALRRIAAYLEQAGIETPLREARLLLLAALNIAPTALIAEGRLPIGQGIEKLKEFSVLRAGRTPFARIVGRREFFGLMFELSAETLVPRPDTETLVEAVLEHIRTSDMARRPIMIADLGVGSGAILAALLNNLPLARGIGVDKSAEALGIAQKNTERLIGADRARFVRGDWLSALSGRFDVIVSNPPYIPTAEIVALDPEVAKGDPLLALDGGTDGLDAYRQIASTIRPYLAKNGLIALEIGAGQANDVVHIFESRGLSCISRHNDLGGHPRAVLFCETFATIDD